MEEGRLRERKKLNWKGTGRSKLKGKNNSV